MLQEPRSLRVRFTFSRLASHAVLLGAHEPMLQVKMPVNKAAGKSILRRELHEFYQVENGSHVRTSVQEY